MTDAPKTRRRSFTLLVTIGIASAVLVFVIAALLMSIFERKQEARNPYVRLVDVTEDTTDPAKWGINWAREYDDYKRTAEVTRTRFGGSETLPAEKAQASPWLTRMFAGYAFAIDYRDRRGHAYMLQDQEQTRRVTERAQPGSCLQCHASVMPTYRRLGNGDVDKGFEQLGKMSYFDAHAEVVKTGGGVAHPVSCVDCHDAKTMELRVTRPGFIRGIQSLAAGTAPTPHLESIERWRKGPRAAAYNPNADASRGEMRSFVCAQCHVEYYCGPKTTLFYPWNNGLKAEDIESYYDQYTFPDGSTFYDWTHAETGGHVLKAQHPEFETWSQGIHARSGVSCADCHMPYKRDGAMKVSDHWVRSPVLNIARACQQCHPYSEAEVKARVDAIQDRTSKLMERSAVALTDLLDAIVAARKAGATDIQLTGALALQRRAQWRLDFVAAENSMGFHAPQETARVLAESIDYARQGQLAARTLVIGGPAVSHR
jgi:nitrite reductase (cytochrome c-552)